MIRRQHYESVDYLLIHPRGGAITVVLDSPTVSPDRQRLAVMSMNFADGESPNSIEIWHVGADSLAREFSLETGDFIKMTGWGPSEPRWVDANTLSFVRNYPIEGSAEMKLRQGLHVRRDSRWILTH